MPLPPMPLEAESPPDPAYPTTTPPDAVYPGQTREPLGTPFDEIATPSMWSRLAGPLERVQQEIWQSLGLLERARPRRWISIHYGRIALNGHAWERMRTRLLGEEPDQSLIEPPDSWLERISEMWEDGRARWFAGRLDRRLEEAEKRREACLRRAAALDFSELDGGEIARGPLDEPSWTEILLPWMGRRLQGTPEPEPVPTLRAAVALEQRCSTELGKRLSANGVLGSASQVAYLTIEERIRAIHEPSNHWEKVARAREERVEQFARFDVPLVFWGRPRIDKENP